MLQKQIELGRIVLPPEAAEVESHSLAAAAGDSSDVDPAQVDRQVAWLLEAHRGTGQPLPFAATGGAPQAAGEAEQVQEGGGDGGAQDGGEEAEEEREAAALRAQMRGISRSLWSVVSSGTTSGAGSYISRQQADYQYRQEAVSAMVSSGELTSEHHRRRDAHSAYMEASARDAVLRRGAAAKPQGGW